MKNEEFLHATLDLNFSNPYKRNNSETLTIFYVKKGYEKERHEKEWYENNVIEVSETIPIGGLTTEFLKHYKSDTLDKWLLKYNIPYYYDFGDDTPTFEHDKILKILKKYAGDCDRVLKLQVSKLYKNVYDTSLSLLTRAFASDSLKRLTIKPYTKKYKKSLSEICYKYTGDDILALIAIELLEVIRAKAEPRKCSACGSFYFHGIKKNSKICFLCPPPSMDKKLTAFRTYKSRLNKKRNDKEITEHEYNRKIDEYKRKKGITK